MVLASAWADGRPEAVYGHVITKFSVMRRFTFLWRAFRALESSAITLITCSDMLPKTRG